MAQTSVSSAGTAQILINVWLSLLDRTIILWAALFQQLLQGLLLHIYNNFWIYSTGMVYCLRYSVFFFFFLFSSLIYFMYFERFQFLIFFIVLNTPNSYLLNIIHLFKNKKIHQPVIGLILFCPLCYWCRACQSRHQTTSIFVFLMMIGLPGPSRGGDGWISIHV